MAACRFPFYKIPMPEMCWESAFDAATTIEIPTIITDWQRFEKFTYRRIGHDVEARSTYFHTAAALEAHVKERLGCIEFLKELGT